MSSVPLVPANSTYGIAVDAHGRHLLVSDTSHHTISMIDINTTRATLFYIGTSKGRLLDFSHDILRLRENKNLLGCLDDREFAYCMVFIIIIIIIIIIYLLMNSFNKTRAAIYAIQVTLY